MAAAHVRGGLDSPATTEAHVVEGGLDIVSSVLVSTSLITSLGCCPSRLGRARTGLGPIASNSSSRSEMRGTADVLAPAMAKSSISSWQTSSSRSPAEAGASLASPEVARSLDKEAAAPEEESMVKKNPPMAFLFLTTCTPRERNVAAPPNVSPGLNLSGGFHNQSCRLASGKDFWFLLAEPPPRVRAISRDSLMLAWI
eukprot:8412038-Pyramimonas_sp.AAC.1